MLRAEAISQLFNFHEFVGCKGQLLNNVSSFQGQLRQKFFSLLKHSVDGNEHVKKISSWFYKRLSSEVH